MIKEIAVKYPFYGYKRIWITMRKRGIKINKKKVYRIYKNLSLELKTRKKPKRKLQYSENLTKPEFVNHIWNIDFTKVKINGKNIKILSIMDVLSRKALKIYADISITSQDVLNILEKIFKKFKKPLVIRTDNGPEFRAKILNKFLFKHRIKQEFIPKGKPHKNGFIERLIRSIKEEGLYPYCFENLKELNKLLSKYTLFYNSKRPHSSLNFKTPDEMFYNKNTNLKFVQK